MDNNIDKKTKSSDKFRMMFMVILLLLLIVPLGFISYDKFFNKEKPPVSTPTPLATGEIMEDKITRLNRIVITEDDQTVGIDGKEYKLKKEISVDGAYLLIDDAIRYVFDMETAYADFAYITNKFIIFTLAAQDGEIISYAINKDDSEIGINDCADPKGDNCDENRYQMHDFKLVDGNIEASGHVFCGLDGDCPDKKLVINYSNNTITVKPVE